MNAFLSFALLGLLAGMLSGCSSEPSTKTETASGDPNQVIGHVKWTITETSSGQTLGQGERDVKLGELKITTMSGTEAGDLVHQKLPLSDHFILGFVGSKDAKTGFAFTAEKDDEQTFCWDWFVVNGSKATKLQEAGEIDLKFSGDRIERTEFLTDVSLRVMPMAEGADPLNPQWRVTIAQGSHITWPK